MSARRSMQGAVALWIAAGASGSIGAALANNIGDGFGVFAIWCGVTALGLAVRGVYGSERCGCGAEDAH